MIEGQQWGGGERILAPVFLTSLSRFWPQRPVQYAIPSGARSHASALSKDATGITDALISTDIFLSRYEFPNTIFSTQNTWHLQHKFSYSTYLCSVWVGFLWINAPIILYVLESLVHETTITTLIPLRARAVHQILFTQWNKFASFSEVLSFKSSCCAESPARATLTLKYKAKSYKPRQLQNSA